MVGGMLELLSKAVMRLEASLAGCAKGRLRFGVRLWCASQCCVCSCGSWVKFLALCLGLVREGPLASRKERLVCKVGVLM